VAVTDAELTSHTRPIGRQAAVRIGLFLCA